MFAACEEDSAKAPVEPEPGPAPLPTACPGQWSFADDGASFSLGSEACGVWLEDVGIRLRMDRDGVKETLTAGDFPDRAVTATATGFAWVLSGRAKAPRVAIDIALSAEGDRAEIRASLSRPGSAGPPWSIDWVELADAREVGLALPDVGGRAQWIQNGYDSWSFTGVERLRDVGDEPARVNGTVGPCANNYDYFSTCSGFSWWHGGIANDQRTPGLLWGALSAEHWKTFAAGWYPRDDRQRARLVIVQGTPGDARTLAAGQTLDLDAVWLMLAARPPHDLGAYVAAVAERTPPYAPRQVSPFGWGTWYEYFKDIDAQIVLDNCRRLVELYGDEDEMVCQIDDGYQTFVGDWTTYLPGFADGMAAVATGIRALGLRPGIWIAPLMADLDSELFATRPELFLRDADGEFVLFADLLNPATFAALDVTRPEAEAFLRETVGTKIAEGFSYLKLDFLLTGAYEGRYFDGSTTMEAYQRAMEIIRDEAGDDVFLLASGEPWLPSVGTFDAARGSSDVTGLIPGFPLYTTIVNLARYHAIRAAADGVWFDYDPDNLTIRGPLTESQAQVVTAMTWMSGPTILGDALVELSTGELDRLKGGGAEAMRAVTGDFWTVDLLDEAVDWPIATPAFDLAMVATAAPGIWVRAEGEQRVVAVFAWGLLGEHREFTDHDLAAGWSDTPRLAQIYGADEAVLSYDGRGRWTADVPAQSVGVWRLGSE